MDAPQHGPKSLRPEDRAQELQLRQRSRDRQRVIGLLLIALFILALAFFRFGRHIPWGASHGQ